MADAPVAGPAAAVRRSSSRDVSGERRRRNTRVITMDDGGAAPDGARQRGSSAARRRPVPSVGSGAAAAGAAAASSTAAVSSGGDTTTDDDESVEDGMGVRAVSSGERQLRRANTALRSSLNEVGDGCLVEAEAQLNNVSNRVGSSLGLLQDVSRNVRVANEGLRALLSGVGIVERLVVPIVVKSKQ